MALPSHYVSTYPAADIAAACGRLGASISSWAAKHPTETLLTIPILRGGLFFYADLVRAIDCSVELVTASASSYDITSNTQSQGMRSSIEDCPLTGRRVLLVDDICDSGKTLAALKRDFLAKGALEVKTAVLIRRVVDGAPHIPDYVGFLYDGPEWFVGYGMDDQGKYRNLGTVYRMVPGK